MKNFHTIKSILNPIGATRLPQNVDYFHTIKSILNTVTLIGQVVLFNISILLSLF